MLDNRYGPDIAVLINTCLIARIPPQKQRGGIDWDHDITYRAMYDAKVKASDDPFFSDVLRKDNYLHRHMAAALALNHKAKYSFFLEHRVPPLSCTAIIVLSHMSVPVLDESHIVLSLASADAYVVNRAAHFSNAHDVIRFFVKEMNASMKILGYAIMILLKSTSVLGTFAQNVMPQIQYRF